MLKVVFSFGSFACYLRGMIRISAIPDTLLTCQLGDVSILTDKQSLDVEFATATEVLLSGKFYATNGTVTLCDLRSLAELAIKATGFSVEKFYVRAVSGDETAETAFTAVYCDRDIDIYDIEPLFSNHFLTPAKSRRIAPDSFVFLSFFARKSERLTYHIFCDYFVRGTSEEERGTSKSVEWTLGRTSFVGGLANFSAVEDGVQTIAVLCSDVQQRASELEGAEVELVSFTVRCDNRAVTFFVDRSLSGQRCFYFRNAFNAPDLLYFPAVTTAKTSNDRSLAVLTNRSEFYGNAPKHEFEVQSGALTAEECVLAEQLFASDDVRVTYESQPDDADFDALRPILITDFTCEIADLPEKPNTVKFTWRYGTNRVTLANPVADNIFTEPYNFTFK